MLLEFKKKENSMSTFTNKIITVALLQISFIWSSETTITGYLYRQYAESRLLHAAARGNLEHIKYYYAQGCDINTRSFAASYGYTPLVHATKNDHSEVVKFLLQQRPTHCYKAATNTCPEGSILELSMKHTTIHTPFTVLLWSHPDEQDRHKAWTIVASFNEGAHKYKLQKMLTNFEKFVKENKLFLPQELQDQVDEYIRITPPEVRCGEIDSFVMLANYTFQEE